MQEAGGVVLPERYTAAERDIERRGGIRMLFACGIADILPSLAVNLCLFDAGFPMAKS
jgi:hypothetical protein